MILVESMDDYPLFSSILYLPLSLSLLWLIISSWCVSVSMCTHAFVTLSKCRINSKWVIANRRTFFSTLTSRQVEIDKKRLSAFTIENIMTTARKSNIRRRKDTRQEKKERISQEISKFAAISFIRKVASVECCDCRYENLPWHGMVWKLHVKKTSANSLNHVQNACGPSLSHFYYFFSKIIYFWWWCRLVCHRFGDVIVSLTFVLINSSTNIEQWRLHELKIKIKLKFREGERKETIHLHGQTNPLDKQLVRFKL